LSNAAYKETACRGAPVHGRRRKGDESRLTVDDPDAFYEPWSGMRRYRRLEGQMAKDFCVEDNRHLFDYRIPLADKPVSKKPLRVACSLKNLLVSRVTHAAF
jgi:hypothetical protein